jgi:hypothetical protein
LLTSRAIKALLSGIVDYAGLYPPACLGLPEVVANYERYLSGSEAWMLNRLVLPASRLSEVNPRSDWRVTVIADEEPFEFPDCVESIETKDLRSFTKPVYRELPVGEIEDGFAKIRTNAISSDDLATFLVSAAARRLAFKATAGLHHPVRGEQHGFLNVFLAAAYAWHGADRAFVTGVLNETDFDALGGGDLTVEQIVEARRDFSHSFGSCSFEEPVEDLKQLGWV